VFLSRTARLGEVGEDEWIYLPGLVVVGDSGGVEVELLYALSADVPADLQTTPLKDPYENLRSGVVFQKTILGCFGEGASFSPVVIKSRFRLSERVRAARFYVYGFVPDPSRTTAAGRTKEFSFRGPFLREFRNLRCMVSGQHILEYDGVEQGVFRLNSDFSIGREVVDMYLGLLVSKGWWVF
jgi:hypothetical protein